ncbi:hypothetical protein [Cellulomonas composti]|uniref:Uncharacterized protein n=1 Tax=Cellulomonas composti TaxID=266130 RepID=A0A511J8W8_9CELL|nr:hypothetical protein [Cellulomonas composti]GEL94163.1 hypothetical protein CCO02nite_08210 [Cellulomonas composti]
MTFLLLASLCVPALIFGAVWSWFPSENATPRWRTVAAEHLEAWAEILRNRHPKPPDPFDALWVQDRLTKVADHVRELELDPHLYARAERIIATQLAYDQLLAKACGMAGVEVEAHALGDPGERFREEVELTSRGWSW